MLARLLVPCMLALLPIGAAAQNKLFDTITEAVGALPSQSGSAAESGLDSSTIANGLRQALEVGTESVVARLGRNGGFLDDPKSHIPLPGLLADAQTALRLAGLSGMADDLELRMNRAAEQAVPVAEDLFTQAIRALTFEDVMAIYRGPDDAATSYLERTTGSDLARQMRPIVDEALASAGAVQVFDDLAGQASALPLVGNVQTSLTDHVLAYANDAIFGYLAIEEKSIRGKPGQTYDRASRDRFRKLRRAHRGEGCLVRSHAPDL